MATPHHQVFTSGAYVPLFQPDSPTSGLARIYARKREAIIAAVPGRDRKILDVGGGMGRMSIPLSASHFVTLCDLSPQMLELARPHEGVRLRLQVADACALPFDDAQFDSVLLIDVVPHLPKPDGLRVALREARRVLRAGGQLLVDSTNSIPLWALAYPRYLGLQPLQPRRLAGILLHGGVEPAWQRRVFHYRRRDFLSAVAAAGFRVGATRAFGPRWCAKWHLAIAEAV